jgi:predicted nucleotide-binding protein (sugar kinase/HSP70/actin superfamily)
VAVLGHPYLLGAGLLNKHLFRWLRESDARVMANSVFSDEDLEREARLLPDISWSYERELLAAASLFSRRSDVDGIIYLTSFGCGPDSLVMEMFRRETLPRDGKAFMEVVLDEHSAESGVRTRAEAFVDMLRYREKKKAGGKAGAGALARVGAVERT